jgi:hypothetical protein
MIDLKKKCWREKVTAELTMAHVVQFAQEMGANMDASEVAEFLNHNGTAQNVWMHMMQAGEHYIKSSLKTKSVSLPVANRARVQAAMVQ